MNWGYRIILAFVAFFMIMGSMVYISVKQEFSLESPDYYKKEIEYQQQIELMKNTAALESKPYFSYSKQDQAIYLRFDTTIHGELVKGQVHFFSNMSSKEDVVFELDKAFYPDYKLDVKEFRSGKWLLKLNWEIKDKAFYLEEVVYL